jgi:DNA-binding NtrC family response regulator
MAEKFNHSSYRGMVVVIDDEEDMCKILTKILNMEGYHVSAFTSPVRALDYIGKYQPDVVLTDIRMPECSGMEILKSVKSQFPQISVIIMTAYASIEGAISAMKEGAFHYVTKPFRTEELIANIEKAIEIHHLTRETVNFSEQIRRAYADVSLIGESSALMEIKGVLEKVAPTDSAVLISGNSGTGKELAAKFLHKASHRGDKRFVPIDCACIPENLLESELFGYERGAFTGASQMKIGLLELADGGTLFLDEIGELPLHLQSKLLRVLQERVIQRVGGLKQILVDIRLLAATNRDLPEEIRKGNFRQDLYYRLNVINVRMPDLCEREGDVPVLVQYFLSKIGPRFRKQEIEIETAAMDLLIHYRWPGNVRELENVIERILVLLDGNIIKPDDIPADIRDEFQINQPDSPQKPGKTVPVDYKEARTQFEREYLRELLEKTKGSVSRAAGISGISRRNFYEKLDKLGIQLDEFKVKK